MDPKKYGLTNRIVTLFAAAALAAAPGCSSSANSNCIDQNADGYCDNGGGSSSARYYGTSGSSGTSTGSSSISSSSGDSSGISHGTSSHGGVGSSGGSSTG